MKSKKFDKKLMLSKETISNLNNGEMNEVNGGGPNPNTLGGRDTSPCFCPTVTSCGIPC